MAFAIILQPTAPTLAASIMAVMPSNTAGLGSLVFDFEAEERTSCTRDAVPPARSKEQLTHDKEKLKHFSSPDSAYSTKLLRDVRYFVNQERDPDAILLATKLSAVGYSVNVRTALGGGTSCFRNLRHEFLTVRGHGDFEGVEFIVEPRFREHFSISHPTEEYSELLSHAPDVFVGVGARLVPIVQTLCGAMADSFERKGLTLPPWRRTQAMLSKWLPNRARDVSFGRGSAPPHRPAATAPPSHQHAPGAAPPPLPPPAVAAAAGPFGRISDPLFTRVGTNSSISSHLVNAGPQLQPQADDGRGGGVAAAAAAARHGPPDRGVDAWACETYGFIPFGGAGGCSSDTEGPSPPAAGVAAGAADGPVGPSGRDGAPAPVAAGAAATTGACAGVRRGAGQSSLLASHLQHPELAAAGALSAAAAAAHQPNPHHQHNPGVLQTRPPVHWGEPPIHRVRMGFHVAPPPPSPSPPLVSEQQLQGPAAQAQTQGQGQWEPVPERPATQSRR
ncbi:hypothetical protein PLESTB_001786400 [Pleodorina starrii]|uniref:Uncharacterized protein n=1 Tax=Pleodorina starrii TaxID=330485 RepID=A0A9W6BZV1_9CHLO|nr:hypothetical protein PLESTM_001757200 [Pleodorina starrii]GLC61646.1 hypothetical protein PLESTB_001786400 [Pleodorina starrii]GLC76531.1 hypothetical protein PLESTF_001793300 [Pleodorina starrii]